MFLRKWSLFASTVTYVDCFCAGWGVLYDYSSQTSFNVLMMFASFVLAVCVKVTNLHPDFVKCDELSD